MIQRIVSTTQACLCCLMSTKRIVTDLEETILLYMDTVVELDRWILCLQQDDSMLGSNDQDPGDVEPMNVDISDNLPDLPAKRVAPVCNVTRMRTKKKSSQMKLPNFVKANSLGMLAADQSHIFHGPAMLHWEGGWHGERKIQQVKPLLHIKQSNAEWTTITLHQLYQNETIKWLLERTDVNEKKIRSREMDSVVKVYASINDANNALNSNLPMSAILAHDEMVHIPFRPVGREGATRSSVSLLKLKFLRFVMSHLCMSLSCCLS